MGKEKEKGKWGGEGEGREEVQGKQFPWVQGEASLNTQHTYANFL